jgi:glycine/D-amino acid oxidase-like deaminating enzyme
MHRGHLVYGADAQIERSLRKSFPSAVIDQAWSGLLHVTPTGLPIIRMAAENHAIVFNVGYGGTGVALSLVCAKLAAAVASHGRFTNVEDTRLLGLIHSTRLSVRDSVKALARIARAAAMPWR